MELPLIAGILPTGACYSTEQQRLNAFMAVSSALLASGMTFYNFGPDKPSVENQAYPWFNTTYGRWYFFNGVWKAPVNYDANERRLWVGTLVQLQSYDGGDGTSGPVTDTSGPMWMEDTAFQGRSPMGPGAIPSSNPAKTLAVAEAFGEGAHAQTATELYPHSHEPDNVKADYFLGHAKASQGVYNVGQGGDTAQFPLTATAGGNASGQAEAANVVHPVVGTYIIRPSGRLYYIIP